MVFGKRKAQLNTTARLDAVSARRAFEQNEAGFAGIQHNRDDHETYAVVLPYDFCYVF